MIELFIILLATGFVVYYLVRHPIKSTKFIFSIMGLLILGVIGILLFIVFVTGVLTILG